ncbi:MAG: GIY-YIG nuclease family protein [Methanosarcinales archaeon]|nr:MAG: GIY-YIG nuclease family protein [Methanosarcinales archaeon]
MNIQVGRLGRIKFHAGFYAYVGSALNGLEARIARHLREEKKLYWHIDYLLVHGRVRDVFYVEGNEKKECDIARNLAARFNSIKGFGSSDCDCESHLFYSADKRKLEEVATSCGLQSLSW